MEHTKYTKDSEALVTFDLISFWLLSEIWTGSPLLFFLT